MGPLSPRSAILRNNSHIVSVLTTVVLVTAISSRVTAFPAPQDVEPLTPRRRAHVDSSERPQTAEKRAEHEVSGVHEEHVTLTGLSGVQFRFQLGVEKLGLVLNVLGQGFFGRHGDRSDALP